MPLFSTIPARHQSLGKAWFSLGISALAVAGLYAVLLVLARADWFKDALPFKDFFHTALVVHVNLSVLTWLLCFSSVLWSIPQPKYLLFPSWLAFVLTAIGTALFSAAPFMAEGNPLQNNYVPILQSMPFYLGLMIFAAGITLQASLITIKGLKSKAKNPVERFALWSAGLITLIAAACFLLSHHAVTAPAAQSLLGAEEYFELLFWSAGHALQFTYLQITLLCWLVLAGAAGFSIPPARFNLALLAGNLLVVLTAFYPHVTHSITSFEHLDFYTQQMRIFGGIAAIIIGGWIVFSWLKKPATYHTDALHLRPILLWSILLFGAGGIIGFMISGSNTKIPAHYHGSIVGITLAMMGMAYHILPRLGFPAPSMRLCRIQPWLYGGGQLLHIIGLAWSGGYGALRKTPGAMESTEGQMAMGLMGIGGLLSILGGILFVVICLKTMLGKKEGAHPANG